MFDGIKRKIAATALGSILKSLATDKNTATTITGIIAAAVLAIPGLDLTKLVEGDPAMIAKVAAGLAIAIIGFLATKEQKDGTTTFVGVVAGALYAASGAVDAVTTGLTLAVVGYFTNKPVAKPKQ